MLYQEQCSGNAGMRVSHYYPSRFAETGIENEVVESCATASFQT